MKKIVAECAEIPDEYFHEKSDSGKCHSIPNDGFGLEEENFFFNENKKEAFPIMDPWMFLPQEEKENEEQKKYPRKMILGIVGIILFCVGILLFSRVLGVDGVDIPDTLTQEERELVQPIMEEEDYLEDPNLPLPEPCVYGDWENKLMCPSPERNQFLEEFEEKSYKIPSRPVIRRV